MKGLELAREYYQACRPILYELTPETMAQACAGLCGEGSECFGCDDAISQDHDFSAAFCLWLPETILAARQEEIRRAFASLPRTFQNISADFGPAGFSRRGPLGIVKFYQFFTGLEHPPRTWREWLAIPEYQLAAATNGEIFEDNAGVFSDWRKKLEYYPQDIRLKKLAAAAMRMAQSGQYNLPRTLARGENHAAFLALGKFAEAAIAFVFLVNQHYMPFYKWAPAIGKSLPLLGRELEILLDRISAAPPGQESVMAVEEFCASCASWLRDNNYSANSDTWLWVHGPEIISHCQEPELRKLDLLKDTL